MEFKALILHFRRVFATLEPRTRNWFVVSVAVRVGLASLDLIGLVMVGIVTSLIAGTKVSSNSPMGRVFEFLTGIGFSSSLQAISIAAIGFFFLKALLGALDNFRTSRYLACYEAAQVKVMLDHQFNQGLELHQKQDRENFKHTLNSSANQLFSQSLAAVLSILSEVTVLLTVAICLAVVSPILFAVVATFIGFMAISTQFLVFKRAAFHAKAAHGATLKSQTISDEIYSNFRQIVVLGRSAGFTNKLTSLRKSGSLANANYTAIQSLPRFITEITVMGSVSIIGFMHFLFGDVVASSLTIGVFLAGLFRLMASMVPLQSALGLLARAIPESKSALGLLADALEAKYSKVVIPPEGRYQTCFSKIGI